MKGNNNGGDWRKLLLLLAFGAAVLYWIEVAIIDEMSDSGTRFRETYEHRPKAKKKGVRVDVHCKGEDCERDRR